MLKFKIVTAFFLKYFQKYPANFYEAVAKLDNKSLCIDCGANFGDTTKIFLNKKSKVIAFEPDPDAYSVLHKRFKSNKNVVLIKKAVDYKNRTKKLYFHVRKGEDKKFSSGSSLEKTKPNVGKNYVFVKCIDLIKFIKKHKQVHILKIDIEGYEVRLLPKLFKQDVINKIDYIFVETHEKKWPKLQNGTKKIKKLIKKFKLKHKVFLNWI